MINIIGGGITGLSLAYYLAKRGKQVTLYEKSNLLGGNTSWTILDGKPVDKYYHVLTSIDSTLSEIIQNIGIKDELYPIRTTMAFQKGSTVYPLTSVSEALRFSYLSLWDRFLLGLCFFRSMQYRNWKKLDKKYARDWLITIGGENLYQKFWEPIMQHKFGLYTNKIAATDMWFRLNRLFYTSKDIKHKGTFYIRGSFKTFFTAFEKKLRSLGVAIYTDSAIKSINTNKDIITSITLENGTTISCATLIITTPIPEFSLLLTNKYIQYVESLNRIFYMNNVCLILKTKTPISNYYQLAVSDSDIPFTGIISGDQFYPPEEYGGYITYLTRYCSKDDPIYSLSVPELIEYYLPFIKKIAPKFSKQDILSYSCTKGKNIEAIHLLNYSNLIPETQTPIKGLYLLCSAQIYPEPTVLDTACCYAKKLADTL